MAIDMIQEKTYTLAALAKMHFWPVRRAGKKINVVTLWRWTEHGLNGIRLETILAGGCRVSSVEAVQRFEALTGQAEAGLALQFQSPTIRRHSGASRSRRQEEISQATAA